MLFRLSVLLVVVMGCMACGSSDAGDVSCVDYEPQAPRDHLAASPRENEIAELLALELSDTIVATPEAYEMVARDLDAIAPSVASIQVYSRDWSSIPMPLELDDEGLKKLKSGNYRAWDCPNEAYGVSLELTKWDNVAVNFGSKRLKRSKLVAEYKALPHVTNLSLALGVVDGPDICLEVVGATRYYIVDRAGGDCQVGCTTHQYTGFEIQSGAVSRIVRETDADWTAWFSARADCASRL